MGTEEVRRAIRSDLRRVAVEAPAGCGKTHEAASGAIDLARELPQDREALLLAHTNAAVGEFRRRIRKSGAQVRASTLDAFALELVAPYAEPLGLPAPVIPGDGPGQVPFHDLAPKAAELLRRAQTLAATLGRHYPVIFMDEHQDTNTVQEEVVNLIVEGGGGRLRSFGDPLQAIYHMDTLVAWDPHCAGADCTESLETPHRWDEVPELGQWTLEARHALRNGKQLRLKSAPSCVRAFELTGLSDAPNPGSAKVQPALIGPLSEIAKNATGSLAILTRYNAHVRALKSAVRHALVVQEGSDFTAAYTALERAEASLGKPKAMALTLIDLLAATCTGFNKQLVAQIDASLTANSIEYGRRKRIRPLLEYLAPLYVNADLTTWCHAVLALLREPPNWVKIDLPLSLRVLSRLRPIEGESARALLDAVCRRHREGAPLLRRCASTIHKAKGQAYDHVVLVNCGKSLFPDTEEGRRLLYTALTRAKKSLIFILPHEDVSPLIA